MRDAIKWVRQYEVQMITLTATLSRPVEKLMLRTFLSSRSDIDFVRASVDRPEQSIQVVPVSADDLLEYTSRLTRAVSQCLEPDERCVVFFNDVASLETVSDSCHTARYHAQLPMTGDTKEWNLEAFVSGEHKVMAATTSLTLGFHFKAVRVVIVVNGAYGLREVVQQFGRGGRDGLPTICYFLDVPKRNRIVPQPVRTCIRFPKRFVADIVTHDMTQDYADVEALCTFLSPKQCRTQAILKCYNREKYSSTCLQVPGHQECDTCDPDNINLQFAKDAFLQKPVGHETPVQPSRPSVIDNTPGPMNMHPLTSRTPTIATFQRLAHDQQESLPAQPPNLSQATEQSNYGDEEPLSAEMLAALDECEVRPCSGSRSDDSLTLSQQMSFQPAARRSGSQLVTAASFAVTLPQVRHPSVSPYLRHSHSYVLSGWPGLQNTHSPLPDHGALSPPRVHRAPSSSRRRL